jgi:2-phospho-L-lactate guanylyltransferase
LIPIKSFELAKGRLAGALDEAERAALARRMARGVIAATHGLPAWVICDDHRVAELGVGAGANVIWRPARGLNAAVTEGMSFLGELGFDRIVVAHADLPLARDLTWVAEGDGVTIVPDRRNDGTNVMALPIDPRFTFCYGIGSARAHRDEADRLGLACRVVADPALGWDVDLPEDLSVVTIDPEHHRTNESAST